jgi:hypothetical protein
LCLTLKRKNLMKPFVCPVCGNSTRTGRIGLGYLEWRMIPVVGRTTRKIILDYEKNEGVDVADSEVLKTTRTHTPEEVPDLEHYRCHRCQHRWTDKMDTGGVGEGDQEDTKPTAQAPIEHGDLVVPRDTVATALSAVDGLVRCALEHAPQEAHQHARFLRELFVSGSLQPKPQPEGVLKMEAGAELDALVDGHLFDRYWVRHNGIIVNTTWWFASTWLRTDQDPRNPPPGTRAGAAPPPYSSDLTLAFAAAEALTVRGLGSVVVDRTPAGWGITGYVSGASEVPPSCVADKDNLALALCRVVLATALGGDAP